MLTWLVKDMAFSNTLVFVFLSLVALGQACYFHAVPASNHSKSVCYHKYGCFNNTADPPHLPQCPDRIKTTFYLFTRQNRKIHQIIDDDSERKLDSSNYDILRSKTIFVVHGFSESVDTPWMRMMKNVLLDAVNCNVILVDWSKGAFPKYRQAAENTRLIGRQIAVLTMFLTSVKDGSSRSLEDHFYIVGFSLGAHAAGNAGSYLKEHGVTIGRITGLDPAGPLFNKAKEEYRLDKNDATFVDVIHTDAGFAGTTLNLGDADFYPNGGREQPGCSYLKIQILCDHLRAPDYYIATVKGLYDWTAYPCKSYKVFKDGKCLQCEPDGCSRMGYYADPSKTGKFYLKTNKEKYKVLFGQYVQS